MKNVNVGIIGLGTVGSSVVKTLSRFDYIKIKRIAVKSIAKKRDISGLDTEILTDNPYDIVKNPEIEVIVEVIGGIEPAFDLIKTAIKNKKHIVTANKELLAKHGEELFNLAKENDVVVLYEAAIAGGIPIIMPVKMTLAANCIHKIAAILNGTTNYILTKMDEQNVSYEAVLKEAQALGYAEADPTGDVEGYDAAYKLATLSTIAFQKRINIKNIYREGITKISAKDMQYARQLGYKIKLIALAKLDEKDRADVRVHPMLVPKKHILAGINGVTNGIMLEGDPVGQVMFTGPGAGGFPTASSVVGDIIAIASELNQSKSPLPMMRCNHSKNALPVNIQDTTNKYYILINAKNTPGVIGVIGTICGNHNINLENLLQKELQEVKKNETAEVVVITGLCREKDVQAAIADMNSNKNINEVLNLIRVMD